MSVHDRPDAVLGARAGVVPILLEAALEAETLIERATGGLARQ